MAQIKVEDLLKPGPQYKGDKLALYEALYCGGDKFEAIKPKLLTKREIEKSTAVGEAGQRSYKLRLERAAYVNRLGGIIDFFTAYVFRNNPRIVPQATGPEADYWNSLNEDADGNGTPFATLCRQALREMLISSRPYFKLNFDETEPTEASISLMKAQQVDDWEFKDGKLEWVRVHAYDVLRPMITTGTDKQMERHTWTYYTADSIEIYEAKKPVGEPWAGDAVATSTGETHDLEQVPFFDIKVDEGLWLIERLFDAIKALFNREAATQFALDSQCFAIPVLTTEDQTNMPAMQASQVLALCLRTGEKFEFVAPPTTVFTALSDDIKRLREAMYECLQSLAMNAASIPQAGRMSGDAVQAMQMPMTTLVNAYAWPVKDAMQRLVNFLKEYRGDEFDISLEGFEQEVEETTEEEAEEGVKKAIGIDGEEVEGTKGDKKEPYLKDEAPKSGLNPDEPVKVPEWK